MAREPTSIIEAFACHPSAVVEIRTAGCKASWTWHGACLVDGASGFQWTARQFPDLLVLVHGHVREYLADCPIANDVDHCYHCYEKLAHLPPERTYE